MTWTRAFLRNEEQTQTEGHLRGIEQLAQNRPAEKKSCSSENGGGKKIGAPQITRVIFISVLTNCYALGANRVCSSNLAN